MLRKLAVGVICYQDMLMTILLIVAVLAGMSRPAQSLTAMEQVVAANNDFAMDLYAKIRNDPGQANKNIFFSPFSVSTALALIYAGARGNTKSQMGNVLNLDSIDNVDDGFRELLETFNDTATEYTLNVVNALFRRKKHPFLQTYLDLASQSYHSLLRSMDFVKTSELSRIRINRWVANTTNKKILNLLGPGSIDASTVLVVVNAIYFNGFWKNPFDAHDTYPDPFNLSASNSVDIDMMNMYLKPYYYAEIDDLDCQILELPYVGDQLAMHILLPNKVDGLASLESKLTIAGLNDAISSMYETDLDVSIPKFKLTQTLGLSDILKSMGMVDVFDDTLANLSGIDNSGDLSVSGVIHKAYVDVNEEGTEAAGATGMILGSTGFAEPVSFKANHPFLFFIKDNATGSILFSGRFVAPSGYQENPINPTTDAEPDAMFTVATDTTPVSTDATTSLRPQPNVNEQETTNPPWCDKLADWMCELQKILGSPPSARATS